MKNFSKQSKITAAIVLMLVLAGFTTYGLSNTAALRGFFVDDLQEQALYEGYKTFFRVISDDVSRKSLPGAVENKLQKYYKNDLDDVSYAYSKNINDDVAITDCYRIYFGGDKGKRMVEKISANDLDSGDYRWLAHELAHTEQCYNYGAKKDYDDGRKEYALKWFDDVSATWLKNPSTNVWRIHNAMPLEEAAEEKALEVRDAIEIEDTEIGIIRKDDDDDTEIGDDDDEIDREERRENIREAVRRFFRKVFRR